MRLTYFIRRLLLMIPTFFGISVIVFGLTQVVPGGPVDTYLRQLKFGSAAAGSGRGTEISPELIVQLNKMYGFDKPIPVRYVNWMGSLLKGDFGESYTYKEPVLKLFKERMPVSLTFGIFTFILVYSISIPLGIMKAIRNGSHFDGLSSLVLFVLYSIPSYALGTLLIVFLCGGSFVTWFPLQGLTSENFAALDAFGKIKDYLHHITLPLTCYIVGYFAFTTMLMKNSFLEQVKQDYVRTARAKGLPLKKVYWKHVLKNAMIPIATDLGSFTSIFLSGSILIEQIFGLDGLGLLNYDAILARDYPVVLGEIVLASIAMMAGVLLSDFLYVLIDPRIDFK